jgi:hypothetical protein
LRRNAAKLVPRAQSFFAHRHREIADAISVLPRIDTTAETTVARSRSNGPAGDVDPARYRAHVEILAGERPVRSKNGKLVCFVDRFVPSRNHQLDEVLDWLMVQYGRLGFGYRLDPVIWRGRLYHNLVVRIPGEIDESVLLCDHYDVADKEPIVRRNRAQLFFDHGLNAQEIAAHEGAIPIGAPVPGADDNASATAALIEMAHRMRASLDRGHRPKRTIELVHLVGEELPADCLGARTFLRDARARNRKIAAAIVLDMIGVDRKGERKLQVSVGRNPASLSIASAVERAISDLRLDLRPILRPYGTRKSFLHQTDAIHFSRAGVPVVLLNEHVNDDHDLHRVGYHDEFDISRLMHFDFATDVCRAACEAVHRCAMSASISFGR